jgi:hypothetical protein
MRWKNTGAFFESAIPDRIAVAEPVEQLDSVATFRAKDEQVPRKWIVAQMLLDERR